MSLMEKKVLDYRGQTALVEITLSDGSKAYDVEIGQVVSFHASSDIEAREIFNFVSAKSKTVADPYNE